MVSGNERIRVSKLDVFLQYDGICQDFCKNDEANKEILEFIKTSQRNSFSQTPIPQDNPHTQLYHRYTYIRQRTCSNTVFHGITLGQITHGRTDLAVRTAIHEYPQ